MAEQRKFLIASRMCFRSTDHSWLNHRRGRMTHYIDSISLCTEMVGAENFNKLDHLQQLLLEEMCSHIRRRLTALSIQYSLKHTVPRLDDIDVESLLRLLFNIFNIAQASVNFNVAEECLCDRIRNSVTYAQYRAFMRAIFGYLLPLGLIGKCNMKPAVDRISCILFKLGFDESIRLSDLFSIPFKTSAVKWLRHLPSYQLCCIHRKIMLWLLEFSVHVTRAAFYVTPENRTRLLRFYRKDIWKRIESHSFHLLSEKRDLKKVKGVMESTVGAQVRFLPKNSGTRSLIVSTGKSLLRRYSAVALKIVSVVIDLVCTKQRRHSKGLPLTGAAIWNDEWIGKNLRSENRCSRLFRLHQSKSLAFYTKETYLVNELCVTGEMVMRFLETYVINKEFKYRNGVYRAFRGIPQGNHASTRLCDLYLGAADCERYFELMKRRDTLLIRYVDDYLLLTTDMNVARKFLEVMHLGSNDSYNIIADSTKTVINFYCECSDLLISGKMVGSCSAVPWCGYVIYPGLKRYCIDWAKIHSEKAIACRIVHKMGSREKRIAVLRFLKASLLEKYRMVHRFSSDKWKISALKKFAAIGIKLYARPYARKVRLSMKGRWNRVFWQKLRAWLRQGFAYSYNTKLAHLFG